MEILGFLLIILAIWCGYCGFNSYNPFSLLLAILTTPGKASTILASAKSQAESALASSPTSATNSASGGSLLNNLENPSTSQSLSGTYGPFSTYHINRSFAAHVQGGSTAPGIDFGMPVGTPLYTPFSGTVKDIPDANPLAGNEVVVTLANGYTFSIKHVSGFVSSLNGKHVSAGQEIALSGGAKGAPGAGDSTGPHAHVDLRTPSGKYVPFNSIPFG